MTPLPPKPNHKHWGINAYQASLPTKESREETTQLIGSNTGAAWYVLLVIALIVLSGLLMFVVFILMQHQPMIG